MVTGASGFPGEQSTHTDRSLPGKGSEGTSQGRTHLTVTAALPPTRAGHSATTHFHETVPRSPEGRTPGHLLAPGCPSTRLDEVRRRSSAGVGTGHREAWREPTLALVAHVFCSPLSLVTHVIDFIDC